MPEYVVGSYIRSPAARRFRLVNFDASFAANGYKLKQRHCEELDKLLQFVSQTTSFSYWLIGFASKTGPAADNQQLSNNRALAVEKYLSARNPAFADPDRVGSDPLYWRKRGDTAFQPFGREQFAALRQEFARAEKIDLLER